MDGGGEVLEGAAALLAAGLDDRKHRLHEAAAAGALRAERELPPDDGMTQRAFARVVRRLDAFLADERPEPIAMLVQQLNGVGVDAPLSQPLCPVFAANRALSLQIPANCLAPMRSPRALSLVANNNDT